MDQLRASAFVPSPKWIRDKRDVVNVVGTGDDCFNWAVLAGLHPTGDRSTGMQRCSCHACKYDLSGLSYPGLLSSITPFAYGNGISINVYAVEDGKRVIFPLCITDKDVPNKHVDFPRSVVSAVCAAVR